MVKLHVAFGWITKTGDVFPCLKRYKLIFKLCLKKIYFMFFSKIFFGLKFLQQDGIFHKVVCVSLESTFNKNERIRENFHKKTGKVHP
jgi:hypothetical protein